MLKITADFFSGIPNPEWIVDGDDAEAVLKDLAQHRAAVASLDSGFQGLGNRGLIVEALSEHVSEEHGLPPIFKLANGGTQLESKGIEVADRLISAMLKDGAARHPAITNPESITRGLHDFLKENIAISRPTIEVSSLSSSLTTITPEEIIAQVQCAYEATWFNPGFWNNPAHQSKNNCYNYATNRRTDTFAQPGRASGHMYSAINCHQVTNGAVSDGASIPCAPPNEAPRWFMALVIAPGPGFVDFHWYRKARQGFWGHKPGGTAARNYDNSGRIIYDPRTANRGPYTIFCGFMYAQRRMVVK
jgi:hypothetical protein